MAIHAIKEIKIFYSYAPSDEVLLIELDTHLMMLQREKLECWDKRQLLPGIERTSEVQTQMEAGRDLPLLLPSFAEQQQIVLLVEERLSIISALEASVEKALKQAERMRQAILHRAFTGKLVPQDPNDEPASALLERIRQEREQVAAGAQVKKREQVTQAKKTRYATKPTRVLPVPEGSPQPLDETTLKQENLWAM